MLLNDAQIALNDVLVNIKDAADHYDDAAGMLEPAATAALFRELAQQRRDIADELESHIRNLGGLPRNADGDRETVARLLARLKATLSADKRIELLTEREHVEGGIDTMIATALRQDLPADTRDYLQQVRADIENARQRLAEAKTLPS
ncbi:MAG: PA2169 family four-helix-bundle protein [Gammaproteobacteria bacterium]